MAKLTLVDMFSCLELLCLFQLTHGAINPLDTSYTAIKDENFSMAWTFDNEADLKTIDWSYKKSATATPTIIMSKIGTANATVFNNYNVEHVTNGKNGEIKLKTVTMDNAGIYYCEVNYKLGSGHITVTGTATLTVTAPGPAPGPDCVCDCECKCEILVIVCAVFDGLGIIGFICDIVATLKKLLKSKVGLVLFGIAVFVLFIISIGLGGAALGNDDCDPDCCCPDEDCCCSDWVGNGATAFVVISSLGAVCAAFISFLICVNAIGPGKKEEGGPDGPDGGHNGGGALMTHARVHAGHEETHRGSLSNRPMPAIPTHQGQDKKGRGLSANFDDDHPMVSISVPEKKAGDLGPLHEEPQKKKKKKKKRTDEE